MEKTPPIGFSMSFHTKTMPPPESMPAKAPARFVRFQKREKRMMGPKVAPKPAHAKDTTLKMMLFSSSAMITPNRCDNDKRDAGKDKDLLVGSVLL